MTIDTLVRLREKEPRLDAYQMHQAVYKIAQGDRILWANPTPDYVAIRSASLPRWEKLPALSASITETRSDWPCGLAVDWAIIANPTRSKNVDRHTRGAVTPVDDSHLEQWMTRKLSAGITVKSCDWKRMSPALGNQKTIALSRVAYSGTGTVIDPDALAVLILSGVGRGKGLGCGMLKVGAA